MKLTRFASCVAAAGPLIGALYGCQSETRDRFGRTYYIDGAGNWGFGVSEVREGLTRAGYQGSIRNWRWSKTLNPALDQTLGRPLARLSGVELGHEITAFCRRNPGAPVNIIALSAGTGVALWACESVKPPGRVRNVILLGSSISCRYDVRKALENIDGKIYVYYSPHDEILNGPVRALGTIDGTFDESAGLVGLRVPPALRDRVVNIPWSSRYERYGWTGAHTDCTSEPFVRAILSQHIVERGGPTSAPALAVACPQ